VGKLSAPERLTENHDLSEFRSKGPELDDWLRGRALKNEPAGASRTYVVCADGKVVGFYCLATGGVAQSVATTRVRRNMPNPVPVVVVGRMAVDERWEGKGIGRGLIKDAILRTLQAAEVVGIRAILIHAKSEDAKRFYIEKCGLTPSPVDEMTLMITLADPKAALTK
jgi:GNAT superfamily N-acetyltransferase